MTGSRLCGTGWRLSACLGAQPRKLLVNQRKVESRGIPHLAKNERDAPNFLYAALDKIACAPFFKERRIRLGGTTELRRKSGGVGHPLVFCRDKEKHFQDVSAELQIPP